MATEPTITTAKQIVPPDIPDVLAAAKRDVKTTINAVNIGIIQEFDPARQIASIRLAIKQVIEVKPDGTRVLKEHPLILECPVMTLFGGNSFINLPIAPGDNCIVLFNDREIDNWLYNGGVQTPTTARVHDITDAIAIVGIRSFQDSIADFLANGIRLSLSADTRISMTEGAIASIAALFTHAGNMLVTGRFDAANIHAGNGANGTFNIVTVVDGIVTGGS